MRRIVLLFAIFCSVISAKAQVGLGGGSSVTGRISGTVTDSLSGKPLDYATVSLFRSGGKVPLNGVLTDGKGNFKLDNIKPGNYKLAITYIGYPTKTIDPVTTTPSKPDKNVGTVLVSPSAKALKEVVVTGQAPVIETKIDKIVYNAEKDITTTGGNATDVLRKVPLVSVDLDGNVSLRGDQNVRVLINGKPSGALSTSLADVLRTIPADQIKNIEVITSPSAKYDAEGSGGIINIITKTRDVSGLNGSVSGGVGTRQNNGNVNLNYKHNRLSLSANVGSNYSWPQTSLVDFNSTAGSLVRTQESQSKTKRYGTIGSVNGNYDFNEFNSINTTFRLNGGGMRNDGTSINTNSSFATSPTYNSTNYSKGTFSGFDWNAGYTHKFKKKDEELDFAGQWSHSSVTSDYNTMYSNVAAAYLNQTPNQMGSNDGKNDEYTIQADYALPIGKSIKLEAGGKSIFRRLNSNSEVFRQPGNAGPFLLNDTASYLYDYNQDVYAGYTVLSFTLPKNYSLQVGARVENTQIDGDPNNATQPSLKPFSNSYTTFIPSFILSKQITATQTLKLTYNKRIQRPSLQFLNPFINKANPDNQSEGNPNLSPEITQSIELGYTTFIKSSVINFSVYYKHTTDLIEGIATNIFDPDLGRNITRTDYQNIGTNNSVGASFFGSVNPIKILTIRGSINGYTYNPTAGLQSIQQTSNGTFFQYNAFMSASLALQHGLSIEGFGVFNSPRRTIQGKNPSFNLFGFGVKKEVLPKKLTLGLNALSPFQKYLHLNSDIAGNGFTQSQKISYPLRSFGISVIYNFGKITYGQQQKKTINNDDLMQGDQNGGGMGSGAPAGGGRN
ncbi:TonB-dependent receptor domain-containing protein [Mucilaginibacter sp. KACC 22063]|uniref:TonB-dependent receptor domain-containing protein n=1 Tax=Mucilaginibacter sp. KACC 22063 TaxID=3025666 RepID=UPI002365D6E8|nr:TonB-dependent receptor [Mucilaginibacter sp. KACC 22063]WDF54772.1 TonB-dependent receptor [Mucilaginibacter sp. KACC 22063]